MLEAQKRRCHPERKGPQAFFSLGVVSRRICGCFSITEQWRRIFPSTCNPFTNASFFPNCTFPLSQRVTLDYTAFKSLSTILVLLKVPSLILSRANAAILLSVALLCPPAFATRTHHSSAASHSSRLSNTHASASHASASTARTRTGKKSTPKSKRLHGQQAIDTERVSQIQAALIREHYLTKEADGSWDSSTEAAMQKYQGDHGWQTKLMPDARAIKALGLGPDYSNAINAKAAAFGPPPPISTIPPSVAAGFAEGSGVVH